MLTPRPQAEAVRVTRGFSFAGAHVVIVGGLVPSLLVPQPEPGLEQHIGTQDLDLCLSVALVDGSVGNYDRLEKCLKDSGFRMVRRSRRPRHRNRYEIGCASAGGAPKT